MPLPEAKAAGLLGLMICLGVLKVGSSDTLARYRIFLECRMIEARGPRPQESQKGH